MTMPQTPPLLPEDPKRPQESLDRKRELDLREREVKAREDEVKAKKGELDKSKWSNPLVLGLFAAAIGLIGNIWVEHANNKWAKSTEQFKAQSTLILEAIRTGNNNTDKACQNLLFFVRLGLVEDGGGTIKRECASAPQGPPSLPASQGNASSSQAVRVLGIVTDERRMPIAHATVAPEGLGVVAITDDSGRFLLDLPRHISSGDELTLRVTKQG